MHANAGPPTLKWGIRAISNGSNVPLTLRSAAARRYNYYFSILLYNQHSVCSAAIVARAVVDTVFRSRPAHSLSPSLLHVVTTHYIYTIVAGSRLFYSDRFFSFSVRDNSRDVRRRRRRQGDDRRRAVCPRTVQHRRRAHLQVRIVLIVLSFLLLLLLSLSFGGNRVWRNRVGNATASSRRPFRTVVASTCRRRSNVPTTREGREGDSWFSRFFRVESI